MSTYAFQLDQPWNSDPYADIELAAADGRARLRPLSYRVQDLSQDVTELSATVADLHEHLDEIAARLAALEPKGA